MSHIDSQVMHQILNDFDQLIYWKDCNGRYLGANQAYISKLHQEKRLPNNTTTIIGLSDRDLFPDRVATNFVQNDEFVIKQQQAKTFIERSYSTSHYQHRLLSRKCPLLIDGKLCGVIGKTHDFSSIRVNQEQVELTSREWQVYVTILYSMTAKEAAEIIGISDKTIEKYIAALKTKLNCYRRSELITLAKSSHLEPPLEAMLERLKQEAEDHDPAK